MKPEARFPTRERLVAKAMALFAEKGYDSTSVADVLKAASVNSGSLYHFFPGKQDLPPRSSTPIIAASARCCWHRRGAAFPIPSSRSSPCSPATGAGSS